MMALRKMQRLPKLHTKSAKELKNGSACALAGLILIRQRPPTANNMTFSTLEDEFGFLDLAIMPNVYARVKDIFLNHCFVEVRGKLQRDANSFSLLVKEMRPILKEEETLEIPPAQYFHHY